MPKGFKKANEKVKRMTRQEYEATVDFMGSLGLGESQDRFVPIEQTDIVSQIVGEFITRVMDNIDNEKDFVTTGRISDITMDTVGGTVNVYARPHLIYQSRGVNGWMVQKYNTPHQYVKDRRPPLQPFIDWIKNKQIKLTPLNDYHRKFDERLGPDERRVTSTDPLEVELKERPFKELTQDEQITRAAWAISTKVHQEGFKGRDVYEKELPQLFNELEAVITNFTISQINQVVDINPRNGGGNRIIIS